MRKVDSVGSLFLRKIFLRMRDLGLNQMSLAKRMKASRPYVNKVLNGDVNITLGTAARFARALEMDFLPELRARKTGE